MRHGFSPVWQRSPRDGEPPHEIPRRQRRDPVRDHLLPANGRFGEAAVTNEDGIANSSARFWLSITAT